MVDLRPRSMRKSIPRRLKKKESECRKSTNKKNGRDCLESGLGRPS